MKRWIIIIAALIAVITLFAVFSRGGKSKGLKVKVAKIDRGTIVEKVNGIGKIQPDLEVQISAKVAGEIVKMPVKEGDDVKVGQLLAVLEQDQYLANLNQAKSSLKAAKANLTKARSNWLRVSQLAKQGLASDLEKESAKADFDYQASQVERAEASVADAQQALEKTVIRSPINGKVTQLVKKIGEIALGSQFQKDVIMTVADLATMQARVEVDENDIVKVNLGDSAEVEIDAFPERKFRGIVKEIANSAKVSGAGTQLEVTNFEVRIDLLDILNKFRPGMSCNADIVTEIKDNAVRVPIQAVAVRTTEELRENDGKKHRNEEDTTSTEIETEKLNNKLVEVVFVVKNDTAYARPIKRGISDENYYEVTEGLNEGEIIVTGPYRVLTKELQNGKAVSIEKKRRKKKKRNG
jgi:HlyD family secretion protein